MESGRSWSTCPLSSDLLPTLHQPADPSTLASDLRTGRVALSRQLWHVRADRYRLFPPQLPSLGAAEITGDGQVPWFSRAHVRMGFQCREDRGRDRRSAIGTASA